MPSVVYSNVEKIAIFELFCECSESYASFVSSWRARHGRRAEIPGKKFVLNLVRKLRTEGRLGPQARLNTVVTGAKVAEVKELFERNPRLSLRKAAQQAEVSITSVHKILRRFLKLKPYRITEIHELKDPDRQKRVEFCQWALTVLDQDETFFDHLWMTDEAHFHLNGYVNSQNCRVWALKNPKVGVQTALYSPRVTVWAAISATGLIGPFFFNENVNQHNYREMIRDFFLPELENLNRDLGLEFFQQDGATPHTARETIAFLQSHFGDRLISKSLWPPRSPDLTPPDFFLWGCLKSRVYVNAPKTVEDLKLNIQTEMAAIARDAGLLVSVFEAFESRLHNCIDSGGGHFE